MKANQRLTQQRRDDFATPTGAIGRSNWLFAGSLRGGQRAAAVMSLIQSARLNGHDPYAYLRDVLERLPSQPNSRIEALLPHLWTSASAT
jgi:transposase